MASFSAISVRRREPELVGPAAPTPQELKRLSDMDDQESLRYHISNMHFYRSKPSMRGRDPARIIREALAKALVFYYPLAGRLREAPGGKLMVECNGEGVWFIEADADTTLGQFSNADFLPPVPFLEQLLYDVPGSQRILDSPLILFQVTRFACGGFSLATRNNHTVCDALGAMQFTNAVAEMARGAAVPTVLPVWARELLTLPTPPRTTQAHPDPDYNDEVPVHHQTSGPFPAEDLVHRTFLFGSKELAALREQLPPSLPATSFEIFTACVWRSRTIALGLGSDEPVILGVLINGRGRCNPPLPTGYYGNVHVLVLVISTAGELSEKPLEYAVGLIQQAKADLPSDFTHSLADLMHPSGQVALTPGMSVVSDVRRAGFHELDFGWGRPVYGGPAAGGETAIPGVVSFCAFFWDSEDGEDKTVLPVCLPSAAMEKFVVEVETMVRGSIKHFHKNARTTFRLSAL